MGKLITVVGNSGVGKTTLTHRLCTAVPQFTAALEQHAERPFQALFAADLQRYALANQIDYLLYRAEQERILRHEKQIAIIDGGAGFRFSWFCPAVLPKGIFKRSRVCVMSTTI